MESKFSKPKPNFQKQKKIFFYNLNIVYEKFTVQRVQILSQ